MIKGSLWNMDLEFLFRNHFGRDIYTCSILSSHGSDRIILRLYSEPQFPIAKGKGKKCQSAIGIINKDLKENKAFIEFSKHFKNFKLNVPQVYGVSDDLGCYIIEDLGDTTLFSMINNAGGPSGGNGFGHDLSDIYKKVIKELIRFQVEAGATIDYSLCSQFNEFGVDNIDYDLNYFKERFLNHCYENYSVTELKRDFDRLRKELLECSDAYRQTGSNFFLYRDFQSRNIMIKDNELFFIDYQSGRKGALQYDLASLLYDAKADIPQDARNELTDFYISEAKKTTGINEVEFKHYFWYFAIIRILQALGAYGYLGYTRGKKRFLDSIPYALKNIKYILNNKIENNKLDYIKQIFNKIEMDFPNPEMTRKI